jgi:hypothetical protein
MRGQGFTVVGLKLFLNLDGMTKLILKLIDLLGLLGFL